MIFVIMEDFKMEKCMVMANANGKMVEPIKDITVKVINMDKELTSIVMVKNMKDNGHKVSSMAMD